MQCASNKHLNNIHSEVLLRNHLDKDLQSVLLPLNFMQHLCFSSRCVIQDNFITPKNVKSIIITVFASLLLGLTFLFKLIPIYLTNDESLDLFFFRISQFDAFFYTGGLILNIFITVYESPSFVAMILKINNIHYIINDKNDMKKLKIRSWIMFAIILNTYISNLTVFVDEASNIVYSVSVLLLWCIDANMMYPIGIISLIQNKLKLWTREVNKYSETEIGNDNAERHARLKVIGSYFEVLDAFNIYKKVFQTMILYHTIETFIHNLIYVEMAIEVGKSFVSHSGFVFNNPGSASMLTVWMLKNLALQTTISVCLENFYRAVNDAQTACVLLIKSGRCTAQERRACKNILRAHSAEYSELSAGALFRIDARHPLRLFALIASYTLVLLQFAFMP